MPAGTRHHGETTLFLARHGETRWNVERRWQGHHDSPLTERGVEQGRRLAERLSGEPLAAVYTSDLGRARGTAELVAAAHGLSVVKDTDLREIDTGEWTGRPRDEIVERPDWNAMLTTYRQRPWEFVMPGGETVHDVMARARSFVERVGPRHLGQRIAVITHHVVVEVLLVTALGLTARDLWLPHQGGNCYVSELAWSDGSLSPRAVHDGAHLEDVGSLPGSRQLGT
ncbi:MAG: histidine phosphatase family protein [Chloroflexi bacterium]|nr:histidine phosphatase family protein [Chloroflexota bacterium]